MPVQVDETKPAVVVVPVQVDETAQNRRDLDVTVSSRVGRKWKNLSDFLCHGDVNIGYRIIPTSEIASLLRCVL